MKRLLLIAAIAVASVPCAALANNCKVTVPTGLAFGAYNPLANAPLDSTTTVQIRCSAKTTALVRISAGASGNSLARRLTSGTNQLPYNVYNDAARADVWTSTEIIVVADRDQTIPVFGRIPASQMAAAGTYSDSLTITVEY